MIDLTEHNSGCVLRVRAQPGARTNGIAGCHDGALKIAVTAAPERGKANKAIADLLAKSLSLKKSQIELLSGQSSREKRFLIRGVSLEELSARFAE